MSEKELKNIVIEHELKCTFTDVNILFQTCTVLIKFTESTRNLLASRLWELIIRRNQKHICTNLLAS